MGRKFYELADIAASKGRSKHAPPISPAAQVALTRIDELFDIERTVTSQATASRLAMPQEMSAPLVIELESWMRGRRAGLSRHVPVARAIDYMAKHWDGFSPVLDDGCILFSE